MKFVCLGYHDETAWNGKSDEEIETFMEECFAYDDELRRGGHWIGGEALQCARNAVTLRTKGGDTAVTDGPYAETKEHLGGILFLEARDLNHAVALMSKHPGVRFGAFEIRPSDAQTNDRIASRELQA